MEGHADAAAPKQEAAQSPIQPPVNPPPNPPAPAPEQGKDPDKITKSDRIMIAATIVIAFGTLVSAGAICFQWYEMHLGGNDTKALVGYASRQAADADKIKASADKSAQASRDFADT